MQADLTAQPVVAESHYRFQHYLPSEWIRSIAQDSLGFIWTQGASRVYRFDGYDFKVFKHDPDDTTRSLPRNTIQNIVSDPRGGIWITYHTPGHGFPLARYDIGTDAFIKYNTNVPFGTVRVFRFDSTNPVVWIGSEGKGLYSFNYQTSETINYFNNQPDSSKRTRSNSVLTISDRDSCILVATREPLFSGKERLHLLSHNGDRKSTRLNSSHGGISRMPSSA